MSTKHLRIAYLAVSLVIVWYHPTSAEEYLYAVKWQLDADELVQIDRRTGSGVSIGRCDHFLGTFTWENRVYGLIIGGEIQELDVETGRTLRVISMDPGVGGSEGDIAINSEGIIFTTGWSTGLPGPVFYRVDGFVTGELIGTLVSSAYTEGEMIDALAFDCRGELYGYGQNSADIYRIDTSTGALTVVGPTGIYPGSATAGMAFDLDNRLFLITRDTLYEVDPSSGAAIGIGETGIGSDYSALTFIGEPECRFSLDIGSDTEISDRVTSDAGETLDPGDIYAGGSDPGTLVAPPALDDALLFGGIEPVPGKFDLDGYDCLDVSLSVLGEGGVPLKAALSRSHKAFANSMSIRRISAIALSFDDDDDLRSWPVAGGMPTDSDPDFGRDGFRYEVIALHRTTTSWEIFPFLDERSIHIDLATSTGSARETDDDIDALDYLYVACDYHYVSSDDEATGDLDPGSIYECGPDGELIKRVTPVMLGLTEVADVDAFEFCWATLAKSGVPKDSSYVDELAVLFSTGEDKPGVAMWSGGVDPNSLYISFLDGRNYMVARSDLWMQANIDAIAIIPWCYGIHAEPDEPDESAFHLDLGDRTLLLRPPFGPLLPGP